MLKDDKLFIFECGHVVWNAKRVGGYLRCKKCKTKLRNIIRLCEDCGKGLLIFPLKNANQKLCKECQYQRVLIRSRNKKCNRENQIVKGKKSWVKRYSTSDDMLLRKIAEEENMTREGARRLIIRAMLKFKKNWETLNPDMPNPLEYIKEKPHGRHIY